MRARSNAWLFMTSHYVSVTSSCIKFRHRYSLNTLSHTSKYYANKAARSTRSRPVLHISSSRYPILRVPGNACACIYPDTPAEYLQNPDSRYSGFGAGGKCRKFQVAHVNNT